MYKIGDTVLCRLYNTPEGKFYGDFFEGVIINIDGPDTENYYYKEKTYEIKSESKPFPLWLKRKEIMKTLKGY